MRLLVLFTLEASLLAFPCGTVIQALGQEGILPFSGFFASNKPFGAPFAGLFEQWFVSSTLVLAVPPGDAYLFMINSASTSILPYLTLATADCSLRAP